MEYNCATCDYHSRDKSKIHRHNLSKLHLIKSGQNPQSTCKHIFEAGKRKTEVCGKSCRGDRCKVHKPNRIARQKIVGNSAEYKTWKTQYTIDNRDILCQKKREFYQANKEEHCRKTKEYYWQHREHLSECSRENRIRKLANDFDFVCSEKIRGLMKADISRGRTDYNGGDYITIDWIKEQLDILDNKCVYCANGLKLMGYEPYDKDQFSIDRVNNSLPHIKDNCVISCLICNLSKR